MGEKGHVTVFLCLILTAMLVIGLTAVEVARINMAEAKTAEASVGAAESLKAAYDKGLFEDYHLLAIDSNLGGLGEGKLEQLTQDYLEYTLQDDNGDGLDVKQVALSGCKGLLDNDCENMKEQISEYMKIYASLQVAEDFIGQITDERSAGEDSRLAVQNGREETNEDESSWSGTDPRDIMDGVLSGGILALVVPSGDIPADSVFCTEDLPSSGYTDESVGWQYDGFDDLDTFERQLNYTGQSLADNIGDNIYGIGYALAFFDSYTDEKDDRTVRCEVEYLIAGKDNDRDNLQGVVNKIVLHRLPVNMAYLLTDTARVAQVEAIAAVLALAPGITYSAAKYLLLGCWAYAETMADIKVLLSGGSVRFIKSSDTWITDIDNLGALTDIESQSYEGVDSIDYQGYLAILLAENVDDMYIRMADIIQINLSEKEEAFMMKNMVYEFSMDIETEQECVFAQFVKDFDGIESIDEDCYVHGFHVTAGY